MITIDEIYAFIEGMLEPEELIELLGLDTTDLIELLEEQIKENREMFEEAIRRFENGEDA